jgi:Beta-propeller repeat/HYDIN/CFA65/VesB-like, Ig-like domain
MNVHGDRDSRCVRLSVFPAMLGFVAFVCLPGGLAAVRALGSRSAAAASTAKGSKAGISLPVATASRDSVTRSRQLAAYGRLPLAFEVNRGQSDSRVKFVSRGSGYTLFLTRNEAVLALRQSSVARSQLPKPATNNGRRTTDDEPKTADVVLRMKLLGANPSSQVTGLDELPGKSNYFIGNNPKKWRTDVPNYARVEYKSIYPGVDLVYYGNHQQLEYDFVVAPGANPGAIKLDVTPPFGKLEAATPFSHAAGKAALRLAANGDVVMDWGGDEVRFHRPLVYQPTVAPVSPLADGREKTTTTGVPGPVTRHLQRATDHAPRTTHMVPGRYVLNGNTVSFQIGAYDRTRPLIIDPVLTYSSLLGGSGFYGEWGGAIAVDASGSVYLTGQTDSPDFPIVNQIPGACNGFCGDGLYTEVAFVTKIDAAGDAIVYSSFIGGSEGPDYGTSIALDSSGAVYLAGVANSSDFPMVNQIPGACNDSCYITGATFVAKIDAAGDALVYSSMIGGEHIDDAYSIGVDASGDAYLAGWTDSTDFPVVNQISGACVSTCGTGNPVAFVAEVNAEGTALDYSTLLGGDIEAYGNAIALDSSGNVYVAGETNSTDFPQVNPTSGACVGACGSGNGYYDGFVTEINAAGNALTYSTLIGGSEGGLAEALALDASGNIYLAGYTGSADFPQVNPIPGACQGTCGTGDSVDAFVAKINAGGGALAYSSLFGGSGGEEAYAIAVDTSGNAFLTGQTSSTDFPLVDPISGACQMGCGTGPPVAFVTEVEADASALAYSSYLGGNTAYLGDSGSGIRVDGQDNVYLTGYTTSTNFPQVNQIPGACNGTCGQDGNFEVVAVKISPSGDEGAVSMQPESLVFGPQGGQAPNVPRMVTLTNTGDASLLISSIAITGQNRGDFAQANNCPISPNTLAPGHYCSISVIFQPAGSGTLNADLTVSDNVPGSPQSVSLTGTGVSGKPGLAGPQGERPATK